MEYDFFMRFNYSQRVLEIFTLLNLFIFILRKKDNVQGFLTTEAMKNTLNKFFLFSLFVLYTFFYLSSKYSYKQSDILFRNFSAILHIPRNKQFIIANSHNIRKIHSITAFVHVYIIWQSIPNPWILKTENETILCGENGFIHEYVKLRYPSQIATVYVLPLSPAILDIQTYPPGNLPNHVQKWQPPFKKADILLFPTHADDEFVFLCGVIGKYSSDKNIRIQVAYICEFWSTDPRREHEKLNGLWKSGIRNYPISGPIPDFWPKRKVMRTLQIFKPIFYDPIMKYIVNQIRRFKPSIIVGHDFMGEYNHAMHVLVALVLGKAVKITNNADAYPDSASRYGLWDTPKTYIHIYGNNQTNLDILAPIPSRGNLTGYDIVNKSFYKHVSQIKIGRYQIDINKSKCTSFGLYRSLVGPDVKRNDLFENIKL